MIDSGFEAVIINVASLGLDEKNLGQPWTITICDF